MDQIVWFVIGFLTCFLISRHWIISTLEEARDAYSRALKLNEESQSLLDQAQENE